MVSSQPLSRIPARSQEGIAAPGGTTEKWETELSFMAVNRSNAGDLNVFKQDA